MLIYAVPNTARKDQKSGFLIQVLGWRKDNVPFKLHSVLQINKVRIGVIFRGGKRISEDEMAGYKSVDVYWQENDCADTKVCVEWVERTRTSCCRLGQVSIFCDKYRGTNQ